MTLLQMRYILEVERCGSMNRAAQDLFLSQSALSTAILEVEKELGITIFRRSNRGVVLTEDGRELVMQIAPIVERSGRITRYYSERKAVSFKEMEMAAVIDEVFRRQSALGIIFVSDMTEHFIGRILREKDLEFFQLAKLRPRVFMRRGHPLASEPSVRLEQLYAYPYVVFTQSDGNYQYAEEAVVGTDAQFDQMVCVSDRATAYNVIAHTNCVSTGSGVMPEGYGDDRLLTIPLTGSVREMRLGYIKPRSMPLTETGEKFVTILTRSLAEIGEEL